MEIVVQQEVIEGKIYMIRGHKVMLSSDLTELYGVEPRALIQAVKRNVDLQHQIMRHIENGRIEIAREREAAERKSVEIQTEIEALILGTKKVEVTK